MANRNAISKMAVVEIGTAISPGDVHCSCACHLTGPLPGALVFIRVFGNSRLFPKCSGIGNSPAHCERAPFLSLVSLLGGGGVCVGGAHRLDSSESRFFIKRPLFGPPRRQI